MWEYKGQLYNILFDNAQQKINGFWRKCVIYQSELTNEVYVREKLDFFDKFRFIENNDILQQNLDS